MHISLDREPCCRQQQPGGCDIGPVQPQAIGELEPTFNATGTVIVVAKNPGAPVVTSWPVTPTE